MLTSQRMLATRHPITIHKMQVPQQHQMLQMLRIKVTRLKVQQDL